MIYNDETYSKHRYEINIVDCANDLVEKMKVATTRPKNQISVEEYELRLKEAINAYKWSIDFDDNASEVASQQACVISPTHPAFDFWLALHLSIEDVDEIPMLLDAYFNGEFGKLDNFLGHVQYFVLKIMKTNVFFDFKEQKLAVINWVRDHRNSKQIQRIGLDDVKVVINENNVDQLLYVENFINQRIENKSIQNNFNTFNSFHYHSSEKNSNVQNVKKEIQLGIEIKPTLDKDETTFELIDTSCTFEKAFEHFSQLTTIKDSKKNAFLSPEDIEQFLCSNFYFEGRERVNPAKPLFIRIAQKHLNELFYDFQLCYDYRFSIHKSQPYYDLLKRTFHKQYMDTSFKAFLTNFSRKYKNYPFKAMR
jgi:hypothetical protein